MNMKVRKGFTLTELLIVMAVIVVLAAVAVPTFGKQLETARETGDMEVIRSAYTEALAFAVQDGADGFLDGQIKGTGSIPTKDEGASANIQEGCISMNALATYQVTLADMNGGKFAQNGTLAATNNAVPTGEWKYVSGKLMGYTVPPVNTEVKVLSFKFKFNENGEVVVDPVSLKIGGTTDANCLFTPQTAVK